MRVRATRLVAAATSAALAATLLVACSSGYRYVKNSSARTYFKVPSAWKLYNEDTIFRAQSKDVSPEQAGTLASVFKALSDPNRVRIVNLLANSAEPVCVCDFMPQLGLSQGTVSFHLKKLLEVGLLEREQRATWAFYSLKRDALDRLSTVFETKEVVR